MGQSTSGLVNAFSIIRAKRKRLLRTLCREAEPCSINVVVVNSIYVVVKWKDGKQ